MAEPQIVCSADIGWGRMIEDEMTDISSVTGQDFRWSQLTCNASVWYRHTPSSGVAWQCRRWAVAEMRSSTGCINSALRRRSCRKQERASPQAASADIPESASGKGQAATPWGRGQEHRQWSTLSELQGFGAVRLP